MQRDDVLHILREHQKELDGFGIKTLALFGSLARDEAAASSDADILVEFREPVGLFEFVRLQMYLENLLGRRVDLVTPDALRQSMREQILREAVRAT
jgi:predicted nucleotidyltransferase